MSKDFEYEVSGRLKKEIWKNYGLGSRFHLITQYRNIRDLSQDKISKIKFEEGLINLCLMTFCRAHSAPRQLNNFIFSEDLFLKVGIFSSFILTIYNLSINILLSSNFSIQFRAHNRQSHVVAWRSKLNIKHFQDVKHY